MLKVRITLDAPQVDDIKSNSTEVSFAFSKVVENQAGGGLVDAQGRLVVIQSNKVSNLERLCNVIVHVFPPLYLTCQTHLS